MKSCSLVLALVAVVLTAQGNDELGSSPQWKVPEGTYGQFRLVPSEVKAHVTEVQEWSGPWETYRNFAIKVGFASARQTYPGNFDLVEPRVGLEGSEGGTNSTTSTTVRLFDRASTSKDIQITYHELPAKVEMDREYKAATIAGEDALCSWDVFLRFSQTKPGYIRGKTASDIR